VRDQAVELELAERRATWTSAPRPSRDCSSPPRSKRSNSTDCANARRRPPGT